jgi:hypothetical protein
MRRVARAGDAPGTGAARLRSTRIHLAPSIGVRPGLQRVFQQGLQRHALGPAPLQRPLGGTFPQADPALNVVWHDIAQERMQRAELVTLAKDQPHHVLDLFVRIIDHLASSVVDIPTGEREAQRPPARLLQGALLHPLLEDMELRLTHGAL